MEAADHDFIKGIRYLNAACRLQNFASDDLTCGRLQRLAGSYRERAMALLGMTAEARTGESGSRLARLARGWE